MLVCVGMRPSLADLLNRHIWMPSWSVHLVLIWLNLSTSSPVCLPLCLQLSGFTAQGSDWLTFARLACVFMHASLIISPWPWIYPALPTFTPFYVSFLSPALCLVALVLRLVHVPPLSGFSFLVLFALCSCLLLPQCDAFPDNEVGYRDTHREGLSKYKPIRWKTVSFDSGCSLRIKSDSFICMPTITQRGNC